MSERSSSNHPIILRLCDVEQRVGLSTSQIYRLIGTGAFPAQIKLGGPRSVGWLSSEVEQWIADRIAARDAQ